jgi:hypothetical protein
LAPVPDVNAGRLQEGGSANRGLVCSRRAATAAGHSNCSLLPAVQPSRRLQPGRHNVDMRANLWDAWRGGLWVMVFGVSLTAASAYAQPVFENAYVDTQKNTQLWVWVDAYYVSSEYGLDYYSLAIESEPMNGSVSYDGDWGLMTYVPDEDYEGYDGFTFTMQDELGNPSDVVYVLVYVEPEGSITNLQPVIVGFTVEDFGDNYFAFSGLLLDDQDSYGREVVFGGLLQGQTTTVGLDGEISFLAYFPPDTYGYITIHYVDPYDVCTEETRTCVNNIY